MILRLSWDVKLKYEHNIAEGAFTYDTTVQQKWHAVKPSLSFNFILNLIRTKNERILNVKFVMQFILVFAIPE
jgi:hypothetical protein